ncbi:hypothetical protein TB2_039875 [Malus domestica]
MAALYKLKSLRFGYSQSSCIVASTTQRFVSGDPQPSLFPLQNLLLCRHFTSEIQPKFSVNYLINSCGVSQKNAISASKRVKLRSPERADAVLAILRNHGLSETQITNIVRNRSEVLQLDPEETLLPKLEFFRSIGVSRQDLAITLSYMPQLLTTSLENRILPTYNFLRSLLSEKNVASVLKHGSWIFVEGHSKKVEPKIRILRELGMSQFCISRLIAYYPCTLMLKPKEFCQVVDEVKKMGFDLGKVTFLMAMRALCGKSKVRCNRNQEVYKNWGWSEDDALTAFRKNPQCMITSEEKIMQVMDFLVNKMGWSSTTIAKYPIVLCYSLEKRIIPRCSVVKVLLAKGLLKDVENVSLCSLLSPAEKGFLERFVARYIDEVPQLLSVYQGKVELKDKCATYPVYRGSYLVHFPGNNIATLQTVALHKEIKHRVLGQKVSAFGLKGEIYWRSFPLFIFLLWPFTRPGLSCSVGAIAT